MSTLTNDFSWSVSRDQLFRTCRRAYYFNYYASWGGWDAGAPPRTRQLYLLKQIKTLEMWAGSIVHETIAETLNRYARKQTPIRTAELQARARQKLRAGWLEAVNREWQRRPKKNNLHGLYYGNGKTLPRERTDRVRDLVYSSLATFVESETLKALLAVPYMNWKPVDQLDTFQLDGLKVWCAVDCAFTDPAGHLTIVDWKTGREKPETLRLQLASYAHFARQKWFASPDSIRLQGVFLGDGGRVSDYPLDDADLVEARDAILKSAADMRQVLDDPRHNIPMDEEQFEVCTADWPCRTCKFKAACPKFA